MSKEISYSFLLINVKKAALMNLSLMQLSFYAVLFWMRSLIMTNGV